MNEEDYSSDTSDEDYIPEGNVIIIMDIYYLIINSVIYMHNSGLASYLRNDISLELK